MNWTIDPHHSNIAFSAKHFGFHTVRGQFTRFSGTLDLDESDPTRSRGRVEVEVGSLDTHDERRDGHLRSADFFDVEKHPTAVFETRSITPAGGPGEFSVSGDLTLRGVTRPVTLRGTLDGPIDDPWGNRRFGVTLEGTLDRTQWGLTWNQILETGRLLVGEKITLSAEAEVMQPAMEAAA